MMCCVDRETLEAMALEAADARLVYELRDQIEACSESQLEVIAQVSVDKTAIVEMVDLVEAETAESRSEAFKILRVDPQNFEFVVDQTQGF